MLTLLKTQTVYLDEIEYVVVSSSYHDGTMLENKATGERHKVQAYNLVAKYLDGTFRTAAQRRDQLRAGRPSEDPAARMDGLSGAAKWHTHRCLDYLTKLDRIGAFEGTRAELRKQIELIAAERKDPTPPHVTTVYRWQRKYRLARDDFRALIARMDARGGKGQSRLQPEVETLIDKVFDEIALKQHKFTAQPLLDALEHEIQVANRTRSENEQLNVPSLRTVQRRLLMLAEYDLTVAAMSVREANRRFGLHGRSRSVSRILELVEIDHSPIDLLVVDENGVYCGRPTITVVIDRYSRCVLGYHLSLAGHGAPAVFEALRHALLPKGYLSTKYADLQLEWPCFGWMERVLMDNGLEFHSDSVVDALLTLRIICEYARSRTPNDKAVVERFLRTLNYGFIHTFPGTTLDKIHKRVGFKAEDEACITLQDLDRLLHVWICNVYHVRPHRGLEGRAPITVWHESAKANPPQLKMNAVDVDIEFSQVAECQLHRYGIELNTFVYRSERLLLLGRTLPAKSKLRVKWPQHDVGYIWVWDLTAQEYFKVPNTKGEYGGLTLEQAKTARSLRASGDPSYRQTMVDAGALVRGEIARFKKSKELSGRRKGGRLANETSKDAREEPITPMPEAEGVVYDGANDVLLDAAMAGGVVDDYAVELPTSGRGA